MQSETEIAAAEPAQEQAAEQTAEQDPEPKSDLVREFTEQVDNTDWIPEFLQPAWALISQYPVIGALLLAVAGFIIAKLIVMLFRYLASQLSRRTRTDFDDRLIACLSRPIFITLFFGFLALATVSLRLPGTATLITVRVLVSLLVLYWMMAGFRIMAVLLDQAAHWKDRFEIIQDRTLPLFDIVGKLLLVFIASYTLLQIWNVDATAWLASAGVLGIAVGFAAKDTLSNLFSGVFIVADAPYKIGDFINLDTGERGMVTHVGLRSTRILTRDDVEITVPNSIMGGAKIVNEAGGRWPKMRVRVPVGVAYGTDVDQLVAVLQAIGEEHPATCQDPPPRVRMRAFGDSSLDFELMCWIDEPVLRGKIVHELLMSICKRFVAEGIEIPFPQRDLHLRSAEAPISLARSSEADSNTEKEQ